MPISDIFECLPESLRTKVEAFVKTDEELSQSLPVMNTQHQHTTKRKQSPDAIHQARMVAMPNMGVPTKNSQREQGTRKRALDIQAKTPQFQILRVIDNAKKIELLRQESLIRQHASINVGSLIATQRQY